MENLSKEELLELLYAYNNYILDIVEDLPLQYVDRVPVTIEEYYQNEYQE